MESKPEGGFMKILRKLLAVVVLGAMIAPAVEAKGGNRCKGKAGQCAKKRKPMTDEQKAAAKARREARRTAKTKS